MTSQIKLLSIKTYTSCDKFNSCLIHTENQCLIQTSQHTLHTSHASDQIIIFHLSLLFSFTLKLNLPHVISITTAGSLRMTTRGPSSG